VKRIAFVAVLVVLGVACSASHERSSSPTSTSAATSSSTTVTTSPPTCRGCRRPVLTADVLCAKAFGKEVVGTAATTVGVVRRSGVGLIDDVFKAAFPRVRDDQLAAWCMLSTSPGCYDESAVAVNGARQHIADAGCGWTKARPHAGPPIWTD
jgi:hypothetical protein